MDAARERFDLLLIDTPPATPAWLGDVLAVADLALAPVRPSPDDLRAIGGTLGALRAARTPFAFILTQAPRAKITDETARVLAGHGRVAPVNMAQRVSYAESAATGQGVTEGSDGRASQEVRDLWSYVKGVME
ncbi:ATPase involved in chromosome partitioning-like protein [Rubellimicrobium mesophilum DSM 19309]|uniref:ATPase involved in chromosome partitioning-like protein n=1 Tax=Rubellimicrobium mesophilum DSM 19309 TaxID=442562 RepID=A0A017HIR9_9RHOB|nr:ATPase involved in chromosome partitioning-like protein [Rubellimicrobium mesophilum DSM 19309]